MTTFQSLFYLTLFTIFITLFALSTITSAELLYTPADNRSMRIYGSIQPSDIIDGEVKEFTSLDSIQISTDEVTQKISSLTYIQINLYVLPDAILIPLDVSSANFDDSGNLSWQLAVPLPLNNTGIVIDIETFYTRLDFSDDSDYFSLFKFTLINEMGNPVTLEEKINYNRLQYDDTDQDFDLRFETYLTQAEKTVNANTYYRWSTLLYDTTRWEPKNIQLFFVGPLSFTTKTALEHPVRLDNDDINSIGYDTIVDLPQFQSLMNTQIKGVEQITCVINSLSIPVSFDHSTSILTLKLTDDFEHSIPYRGALSITCPELFVVQKYPLTSAFDGATRSTAVISMYATLEPEIKQLLDIRSQNVRLYEYVDFPTSVIGEGWVENNKVMATYAITYPRDELNPDAFSIEPQESDQLQFEWSKITLRDEIHSYALPFAIYNTTTPWATQNVIKIDAKKQNQKFIESTYALSDIFNAEDIKVEDFIVQQYSNVAEKSPSIDAVNVLRYHMLAAPIQPAVNAFDGIIQLYLDEENLLDTSNNNVIVHPLSQIDTSIMDDMINNIDSSILDKYLTVVGPRLYFNQQPIHYKTKIIAEQTPSEFSSDPSEHLTLALPPLAFNELTPQQQFDLIQYAQKTTFEKQLSKKDGKSHVTYGTVPQLTRLQSFSESITFEDEGSTFEYTINSALVIFDTIQLSFPRGATYFNGNFTTCTATINHIKLTNEDSSEPFIFPPHDKSGKSIGALEELIFNFAQHKKSIQIGDSVTFNCPDGHIAYRKKQPVLATEYLTAQASLSGDGNDDNALNSPSLSETFITPKFVTSNIHQTHSLLGLRGTVVTQTTISFMPYSYYFSIALMLLILFVFVCLCALAIFVMPILACAGVIALDDVTSLTPSSPTMTSTLQYANTKDLNPVVSTNTFQRQGSSSSIGSSASTASGPAFALSPQTQSTAKTTQYGTISTEMDDNTTPANGKQLKSILKKR